MGLIWLVAVILLCFCGGIKVKRNDQLSDNHIDFIEHPAKARDIEKYWGEKNQVSIDGLPINIISEETTEDEEANT